jgi:hypothetical protein
VLAEFASEIAKAELAGLRAEKKLTQRFRAPQTLQILSSAHKLLLDVDALAKPTAQVERDELTILADAIEEVQPLTGTTQADAEDEFDDEI